MKKENRKMLTDEEIAISRFNNYMKDLEMIVEDLEDGTITFEDYILKRFDSKDRIDTILELSNDSEKLCDSFVTYITEVNTLVAIKRLMSLFDSDSIVRLTKKMKESVRIMTKDKKKEIVFNETWYKKVLSKYENDFSYANTPTETVIKGNRISITKGLIDKVLDYIERNDIYLCQYNVDKLINEVALGNITGLENNLNLTREVRLVKPPVKTLKR